MPELTEEEDAETLAAIPEGVEQVEVGQGIPPEELRTEFFQQWSK